MTEQDWEQRGGAPSWDCNLWDSWLIAENWQPLTRAAATGFRQVWRDKPVYEIISFEVSDGKFEKWLLDGAM